jgi:hypothetical protein
MEVGTWLPSSRRFYEWAALVESLPMASGEGPAPLEELPQRIEALG